MPEFQNWMAQVLATGHSVQTARPSLGRDERPALLAILRDDFEARQLSIAGPPVSFDPDAAITAAELLAGACWSVASGEITNTLEAGIAVPNGPASNLTADGCLRLLPSVYRRARVVAHDGALVSALDRVFRTWPLSGVLACLDGKPVTAPDFAGHPGLQLLYAERLAEVGGLVGWVPTDPSARDVAERVYAERGRSLPADLPPEESGHD